MGERRPDPVDRRANCLHLTAKTYPVLEHMHGLADDVQAEALQGVTAAQRTGLIDLLAQVKHNLLALECPASPLPPTQPPTESPREAAGLAGIDHDPKHS